MLSIEVHTLSPSLMFHTIQEEGCEIVSVAFSENPQEVKVVTRCDDSKLFASIRLTIFTGDSIIIPENLEYLASGLVDGNMYHVFEDSNK